MYNKSNIDCERGGCYVQVWDDHQTEGGLNDFVVIGGSAGSIAAMKLILGALPASFPAPVLIVIHLSRRRPSALDQILNRASALHCEFAHDKQEIIPGRIYLAPPERHLVVAGQVIRLIHGPRHNLSRPAIDPLFRSAAESFGPYVTGIVLSGMLDDGAQGLIAIKERGGTTIVQDPEDAIHRGMPESALRYAEIDHVLSAAEIGALLLEHVGQRTPELARPSDLLVEGNPGHVPALKEAAGMQDPNEVIQPESDLYVLSCPECGGPLSEIRDNKRLNYTCVVGHSFTLETLSEVQHDGVERALWTALRSLRELISLRRRMLERMELRQWDSPRRAELQKEIEEAQRDAAVLHGLLQREHV